MIAFDSDRDGERGVYVASHDGTNVRRVSGAGYAAVPTWSPNNDQLAFIRAEPGDPRVWNLWLLSLGSGTTRRLTSFMYGQTWSASWFPDGRRICYTHEDRVIIQDLASGTTREFASPLNQHLVRTPAVSPDGTKVIFQVFRNGGWLLDLNDGTMRCVLTDPTAEEFAWAPDGRRVAFHSRRDGQWGIWMMTGL
jgi:Tol biopolymer transport system component